MWEMLTLVVLLVLALNALLLWRLLVVFGKLLDRQPVTGVGRRTTPPASREPQE